MASNWEYIKKRYRDNIYALKPWLKLTLYGSYFPRKEERLLLSLKDVLIQDGYHKATIVKEHFTSKDSPLEISKIFLENSDVNFLIFTRKGRKYGAITELDIIAESEEMSQKDTSVCCI